MVELLRWVLVVVSVKAWAWLELVANLK